VQHYEMNLFEIYRNLFFEDIVEDKLQLLMLLML